MLPLFVPIVIAGLIGLLSYHYYHVNEVRKKIKWIPAIPGWPFVGNVLDFTKSTEFLNVLSRYCESTYGLCRINLVTNPAIVAFEHRFVEFVLTSPKILNKSSEYRYLHSWLGDGLLTAPGTKWRRHRKLVTPAFHFNVLETWVDIFDKNADVMISMMEKEVNKIVDIYPYVTMCTLDIICEAAMGVPINAQRNPQSDYIYAVKEMCRIVVDRGFHPFKRFDITYRFCRDYYKEKQYIKILHERTRSVIESRKEERRREEALAVQAEDVQVAEEPPKRRFFLDILLDCNIEGDRLTEDEIHQEVDTFMFEGHDTTASAISFTLYCLATYSQFQTQAMTEQKILFGANRGRPVTYRDLQEMKVLEMIIKETLRLYPSVPFYARRTDQDVEYRPGKIIPKDVNIIIFAFGANRNQAFFHDPNDFDPSRFHEERDKTPPYTYIPFSAGSRNCIGQKFAMLEMKAVISKILRYYAIVKVPDEKYEPILAAETVLKSLNGIHIRLEKREWR